MVRIHRWTPKKGNKVNDKKYFIMIKTKYKSKVPNFIGVDTYIKGSIIGGVNTQAKSLRMSVKELSIYSLRDIRKGKFKYIYSIEEAKSIMKKFKRRMHNNERYTKYYGSMYLQKSESWMQSNKEKLKVL